MQFLAFGAKWGGLISRGRATTEPSFADALEYKPSALSMAPRAAIPKPLADVVKNSRRACSIEFWLRVIMGCLFASDELIEID